MSGLAEEFNTEVDLPPKTIYDPENDVTPGIALGIQAILGSVWWFWTMFVAIKNYSTDAFQLRDLTEA